MSARSDSGSDDEGLGAFLAEPEDYRPQTPPPTVRTYERRKYGGVGEMRGEPQVEVGLVSGHPLWGHILYPAAIALARFLELHAQQLLHSPDGAKGKGKGKSVLELGAGGGLPGLVAALEGAGRVVISDFPDASLVNNIAKNVEINIDTVAKNRDEVATTRAAGFTWGSSPQPLFDLLSNDESAGESSTHPSAEIPQSKFDLILLSDLVFNHSQHLALLKTCLACLASSSSPHSPPVPTPDSTQLRIPPVDLTSRSDSSTDSRSLNLSTPAVLCFFSHHRPKFVEQDLQILKLAEENGWKVEKVWEDREAGPAFPEDDGDLTIRGTVHGFMFTR